MKLVTRMAVAVLATVAALGAASRAEAGLIPVSVSVLPDAGNWRWTYGVVVTTDVAVQPGDFFTIYDFGGLVSGSIVAPVDWLISTSPVGPTPSGTSPTDGPETNLTFTYSGGASIVGSVGLGNFWAISIYSDGTTSDFTSVTHRQVDGRAEANITSTDVPVPGQVHESPEPATLALFGLGLPLTGFVSWLRRRRAQV